MIPKLKILLLFFLIPAIVSSQDCTCKNTEKNYKKIKELAASKNTKAIYAFVQDVEKKESKKCAGIAANDAASILYDSQEFSESLKMLQRVRKQLTEPCLDTVLAYTYYLIGRCYFGLASMDSSQAYYIKSAELAEHLKAYNIQVNALSDISWVFGSFAQYDKCIDYLKRALAISIKIKDTKEMGILYSNIASSYGEFYQATKNENYLDSSLMALNSGLKLHRVEKNDQSIQFIFVTFANVYLSKNDYKKALNYCDSVTKMPLVEEYNKYIIYSIKSNVYKKTGDKNMALRYADSCYKLALEFAPPYEIVVSMNELIECYKEIGNTDMALEVMEKMIRLKDSTKTLEVNAQVNELEQKYNKSVNEKKITELNRENELASLRTKFLSVGILAAILILLIIIFFYRQSVLKNKFKALETEQRLNRARMNPHFFFNALASIQTLSMDAENQSKVSSLISKFSKIMRQSLESTYDELATIEDEILFLSNYLDLQKTRFNNKFEYEIKVDENLAQDELKIPSMLLQPFLENSIEHGFKNIDYKGKLDIIFKKEENGISVELKDNGKGFDTTQKHKEYPSRATQIIADRLFILNKQHKSNSNYELNTNPDGKGVCVRVNLPFIY